MERYNVPDYKGPGIYEITDLNNGYVYIGSSKNIHKRITEHFSSMKRGIERNPGLQEAYDDGHSFSVGIVKRIRCTYQKELQFQESEEMTRRIKAGAHLYNDTHMRGGYLPVSCLIDEMAKRYAAEHFGIPIHQMLRNRATAEMWYFILKNPEREEEIRAEYAEAISYQSLAAYHRARNRDYDSQ